MRKMPSCIKCGGALLEGMRFCPYCGLPIGSEDIERFEPAKGEVISAVASPVRIEGMEGHYALAFTSERLIFARIREMVVDKVKQELLKASIFMPGSSTSDNVSRFYEMTPREVLDEDSANFSLDVSDVMNVRLSYDEEEGGRYVVRLRREEGELMFTLPYEKYYRDLLFQIFTGRVTW